MDETSEIHSSWTYFVDPNYLYNFSIIKADVYSPILAFIALGKSEGRWSTTDFLGFGKSESIATILLVLILSRSSLTFDVMANNEGFVPKMSFKLISNFYYCYT